MMFSRPSCRRVSESGEMDLEVRIGKQLRRGAGDPIVDRLRHGYGEAVKRRWQEVLQPLLQPQPVNDLRRPGAC